MAIHTPHPSPGRCFSGFEQGFQTRYYKKDLLAYGTEQHHIDMAIADQAITNINAAATNHRRFFGWLFFISPHEPYSAQRPGNWSPVERYRQEVAFADEQIGRVLNALEASGLFERTIIIIAGDHGEELGDHGGAFHNSTLYTEQYHVPLVIRVPSVSGHVIEKTTNTVFTFPWLLQYGSGALRAAAVERITEDLAPVLNLTHGAMVTEFISTRGMGVSLYRDPFKLNYHMNFGLVELFDRQRDPREQYDLFESHPPALAPMLEDLRRFLMFRGCKYRYRMPKNAAGPTLYTTQPSAAPGINAVTGAAARSRIE